MFEKRNRQSAKLTAEQVGEIRAHYADGATQRDLGAYYGVSPLTIGRIVRGESWRGGAGLMKNQSDVDKSMARVAAMMGVRGLEELAQPPEQGDTVSVGLQQPAQVPSLERKPPPSLLDGGNVADETYGTGLAAMQQTAAAEGLDIEKLRAEALAKARMFGAKL